MEKQVKGKTRQSRKPLWREQYLGKKLLAEKKRIAKLTITEQEIFDYLKANTNHVVSLKQIIVQVGIAGERSVRVHISRMRKKYPEEMKNVLLVWGRGYMYAAPTTN